VEVEEGVVRVWKEWLREMAGREGVTNSGARDNDALIIEEETGRSGKGKEATQDFSGIADDLNDDNILWVSSARNTGLRFKVRERKFRCDTPILMYANEDIPVSYEIEYDGMSFIFFIQLS
jgi:hypothetical protein